MRVKVDRENDALYFRLDENAIVDSEEVRPGVILDYDENGKMVGMELIGIKSFIPDSELTSIQFQTT